MLFILFFDILYQNKKVLFSCYLFGVLLLNLEWILNFIELLFFCTYLHDLIGLFLILIGVFDVKPLLDKFGITLMLLYFTCFVHWLIWFAIILFRRFVSVFVSEIGLMTFLLPSIVLAWFGLIRVYQPHARPGSGSSAIFWNGCITLDWFLPSVFDSVFYNTI